MTKHDPHLVATRSLQDVLEAVAASNGMKESRRRDLTSAVRRTAAMLGGTPREMPADATWLRMRLLPLKPARAGVTPATLRKIKSNLKAALAVGTLVLPERELPSWIALRGRLESDWQRQGLARFARFCSARRVSPIRISDEIVARYRTRLEETEVAIDVDEAIDVIVQTWNGYVRRSGEELPLLTMRPSKRRDARPLSDYPKTLQVDLDAFLNRMAHADIFADDGPPKALRPTSLRNYRASIRQFLHSLVEAGRRPEEFQSLADVVAPETVRAGFTHRINGNGGKPRPADHNIMAHLLAIARYHVGLPSAQLDTLRGFKARIKTPAVGMTDKNRDRLRQFDDPLNVYRLFGLPQRLMLSKHVGRGSSRMALRAMHAVAIEILLVCPVRIKNLAALDIDRHFQWRGIGRRRELRLFIPSDEVKNGQAIEVPLPAESLRLVVEYLEMWRRLVSAHPGPWLFPQRSGGPRTPAHLGQSMSAIVARETGLEMNPHLFRHFAGLLFLRNNAGEYETVRRLLGHRKLDTTTTFYAALDSEDAVRRYDDAVLSRRGGRR